MKIYPFDLSWVYNLQRRRGGDDDPNPTEISIAVSIVVHNDHVKLFELRVS